MTTRCAGTLRNLASATAQSEAKSDGRQMLLYTLATSRSWADMVE